MEYDAGKLKKMGRKVRCELQCKTATNDVYKSLGFISFSIISVASISFVNRHAAIQLIVSCRPISLLRWEEDPIPIKSPRSERYEPDQNSSYERYLHTAFQSACESKCN